MHILHIFTRKSPGVSVTSQVHVYFLSDAMIRIWDVFFRYFGLWKITLSTETPGINGTCWVTPSILYTIYAVHVIHAVHAVYAVYAAYAVYAIHVIYAIYAVYTIYVVYAIYAIYAVYAVTQKVQMYFLSDGRCSLMAPSIGNMHLMSFGFLLQLYTYCIYAV